MKRKRFWILTCVIFAIAIGSAAWFFWERTCLRLPFGGSSDIVSSSGPLTLSDARQQGCPIDLPEGASKISFAAYAQWQAYEVYVKFEAPLDVCKAHALRIVKRHNSEAPDRAFPEEIRQVDGPFEPIHKTAHLDISWFDIHRIKSALVIWPSGLNAGPHQPSIWIDPERKVFYYMYTD